MKKILYKIIQVVFLIAILALSIFVMLNKEIIQNMGNYNYLALFACCFLSNASVFLPAPGLIMVMSAAVVMNPIIVAIIGALGMTCGECIGYFGGLTGRRLVNSDPKSARILDAIKAHGIATIFIFAFIPFPLFDFVGVAAGYLKINLSKFFAACYIGKMLKAMVIALTAGYITNIIGGVM